MTNPQVTPGSASWTRTLGATGLRVSAVSAGGGPLGGMPELFGYDTPEEQGIAVALGVLASPITMIDTANGYSDGRSEERIGVALGRVGAGDVLIATKVDAADGDFSGRRVRASVEESRARLGMDHLPLVHLHDPEFHPDAGFDQPGGAVEALVALRDEGVIGHLGIAAGHVPTIERLLDTGAFEVLLTHSRATLLDRGADPLIDRARAAGLGVVNAAVLGGGLLASRTAQPLYGFRPARAEVLAAAAALHDLADEFGIALADAAVQRSVRDERIDTTVVGFSKPDRIPRLLASLANPVPEEFWARAEELLPDPALWLDTASGGR
ncbi:aldo/keto reductase [Kineococcus rubinsiae]|uniref:aldo/keto reductase n=1 Tax=Kineococcus rubinsiae TaxID=2609562 RepID=UPI00143049B0|nr:aldo/keto reductase [Kineococcus rubinsiae]NIZ90737.1 aldo/keto reductase [Kineococcus rubinsiae]